MWYYDPTYGLASTDESANVFGKVPDEVNSETKVPVDFSPYERVSTTSVWIKKGDKGDIPTELGVYEYGTDDPQQLVQDVGDSLAKLMLTDPEDQESMEMAIKSVDLAIKRWDNNMLLIFKSLSRAVKRLRRIKDVGLAPSVRDAIDLLVLAAATLARDAIDTAPASIDKGAAEDYMDEALEQLAKKSADGMPAPRPDRAIESYGRAFENALLPVVGTKRASAPRSYNGGE
jgi:hypothetical protein